jgi:transposase
VQGLTKRGVRIEFVKESLTFTGEDSPMANLMLSVMGAFAEFERALIRERQREGIALAKQRGAYRGRKKSLSGEQIAELKRRVTAGEQKAKLAREFGISRETLYQYLKRINKYATSFHPVRRRARKPAGVAGHQGRPDPSLHVQRNRPLHHPPAARAANRWASPCSSATCAFPESSLASMSRRFRPC